MNGGLDEENAYKMALEQSLKIQSGINSQYHENTANNPVPKVDSNSINDVLNESNQALTQSQESDSTRVIPMTRSKAKAKLVALDFTEAIHTENVNGTNTLEMQNEVDKTNHTDYSINENRNVKFSENGTEKENCQSQTKLWSHNISSPSTADLCVSETERDNLFTNHDHLPVGCEKCQSLKEHGWISLQSDSARERAEYKLVVSNSIIYFIAYDLYGKQKKTKQKNISLGNRSTQRKFRICRALHCHHSPRN